MLGPETDEIAGEYEVGSYPEDVLDRSHVFYTAAQALGFQIRLEQEIGPEGNKINRATVDSQDDVEKIQALEVSFMQTPIGAIVDCIGYGNYGPLIPSVWVHNLEIDVVRYLSRLPEDFRKRAFLISDQIPFLRGLLKPI